MTRYNAQFHIQARAELRKIPKSAAMTILRKLAELEEDPYAYNTTAATPGW